MRTRIHAHTHSHSYIHSQAHTQTHTHIQIIFSHAQMHTCAHTDSHTDTVFQCVSLVSTYIDTGVVGQHTIAGQSDVLLLPFLVD